MGPTSTRFLAVPLTLALVLMTAPVAVASITATASLSDAVNGQVLDDDFAAGPAGFTFVGFDVDGTTTRSTPGSRTSSTSSPRSARTRS